MRLWLSALVVTQLLGSAEERATREGNELYREGKLDDALASYTKAQVDHPEAAELHYNIGNVHYRKEDTDKAIEEYRTVLQASDELKRRALYNIGNVHYNAQEWQEAVDAYKNALHIDPNDIEARQNLELALQKLSQQQQTQPQPDQQQQQDQRGKDEQEGRDQDSQDDQQGREGENQNQQAPETEDGGDDQPNAPPAPMEMSPEQAEQILQALAQMERSQQLEQQQKQKAAARGKGRYW